MSVQYTAQVNPNPNITVSVKRSIGGFVYYNGSDLVEECAIAHHGTPPASSVDMGCVRNRPLYPI